MKQVAEKLVPFQTNDEAVAEIGKARAERDKLSHELYVMKQKTEQLENVKNK